VETMLLRLASTAALFGEEGAKGGAAGGDPFQQFSFLIPLVLVFLVFYFLIMRPQRREQTKHQAMLAEIKKNDRVITSGGIFGVVTNVNREANEITIKVDETTNTKLRVTLTSIARVLGDEPSGQTPNT
jgi:preprotein translocase subunit YajC